MSAPIFVDTNVLVYVRDRTDEEKQRRAAEWMAALWDTRLGRLSVQVLQEYYVTITKKLDPPRTPEEAREDVLALATWKPLPIELPLIERAWSLRDRFGFSWWDSLIVAAAVKAGCRYLLSEDLPDGLDVDGLTIINPFTHSPTDLLP
ncbi:MAG TPA: PIN domain-containing protein [Longimicrobiales bacterium]|nr:PIN domain-containing protein [Longimicrobiales bacterium]